MSNPEDGHVCGVLRCGHGEGCEEQPTWVIQFPQSRRESGVVPWIAGCDDHAETLLLDTGKLYGPGLMKPIAKEST